MPIVTQPVTGTVSALSIMQDLTQRLNIPTPTSVTCSTGSPTASYSSYMGIQTHC